MNYLTVNRKEGQNISWPLYMVNANEYNLTFNHDFFTTEGNGVCNINVPFILINATGPYAQKNFDDMILLGSQVFHSFAGIQWDYENKKVAFMPYPNSTDNNNHIIPVSGGGFPGWLLALLIVGGILVVAAVAYICYREKKLKRDLEATNSYGALE